MSTIRAQSRTPGLPLPSTFTYGEAREYGLSKYALYRLRDDGVIESLGRGLYRRSDAPLADLGLVAIATRSPRATMCLGTALAHYGLADVISAAPDIALPRGTRPPATGAVAQWHSFDRATFDIGRETLELDPTTSIGLYSAERCVIDAFRMRGTEGYELAHDALRRWLRRRESQPGTLLRLAANWPRVVSPLRAALEVLL